MALISLQESDTSRTFDVGCSGQSAGATTAARAAEQGAGAGSVEVSADPGNNVTRACFAFVSAALGRPSWDAGDYVVRINHTTMDGGTVLTRVDVCDWDGVTSYQTVASNTSPGHSAGGTGVLSVTVNRGTAYTPQSEANSRLFVVLTYQNTDPHGASGLGITPSAVIDTPIDDGVTASFPVPLVSQYASRRAA